MVIYSSYYHYTFDQLTHSQVNYPCKGKNLSIDICQIRVRCFTLRPPSNVILTARPYQPTSSDQSRSFDSFIKPHCYTNDFYCGHQCSLHQPTALRSPTAVFWLWTEVQTRPKARFKPTLHEKTLGRWESNQVPIYLGQLLNLLSPWWSSLQS